MKDISTPSYSNATQMASATTDPRPAGHGAAHAPTAAPTATTHDDAELGPAQTPISEPNTHHELDLRARTLTTLLAALNRQGTILDARISRAHTAALSDSMSSTVLSLKLSNFMAQLLVREHESVAVLSKRTGPDAKLSLVVSIDSGDGEEGEEYSTKAPERGSTFQPSGTPNSSICQNLGSQSPVTPSAPVDITNEPTVSITQNNPTTAIEAFSQVTSTDELGSYLYSHPKVTFAEHVSCMESLLNRTIATTHSEEACKSDNDLSIRLLFRYTNFRSAPKTNHRFNSPQCQALLTSLKRFTQNKICNAFSHSVTLSGIESKIFGDILKYKDIDRALFPHLLNEYKKDDKPIIVYGKDTVWEFHQLWIFAVEEASRLIHQLHQHIKHPYIKHQEQFSQCLRLTEIWMAYLYFLVHSSKVISTHMRMLEPLLTKFTWSQIVSRDTKNGSDDGVVDLTMEAPRANMVTRTGLQYLELLVSSQYSIDMIICPYILPKQPIAITYCEIPSEIQSNNTKLYDWQSVIRALFPDSIAANKDTDLGKSCRKAHRTTKTQDDTITADEAIQVVFDYASQNRSCHTDILRTPGSQFNFQGCWHAESLLATLRYLTFCTPSNIPDSVLSVDKSINTVHVNLENFRNTYARIGTSRRCCLVCSKLISLLSSPSFTPVSSSQDSAQSPSSNRFYYDKHQFAPSSSSSTFAILWGQQETILTLSSHQNIYPTSLPPFLPVTIATELVNWLEALLRNTVAQLVLSQRELNQLPTRTKEIQEQLRHPLLPYFERSRRHTKRQEEEDTEGEESEWGIEDSNEEEEERITYTYKTTE